MDVFVRLHLGMLDLALIVEELSLAAAARDPGPAVTINPIFGGVPISKFGSEQMKRELLPALVGGKMNFCMALTEPDAGTNTLAMKSYAEAESPAAGA